MPEIQVKVANSNYQIEIDPDEFVDLDDFEAACQERLREEMGDAAPVDDDGEPEDLSLLFGDNDEEFPRGMVDTFGVEEELWEWLKLDDDDQEMVKAYHREVDHTESLERVQERYQGTFRNKAEWAEDYMESTGMLSNLPDNLQSYFDYERFAEDCERGGDMTFVDGGRGVYAFSNH